jgi:hypothetical protein
MGFDPPPPKKSLPTDPIILRHATGNTHIFLLAFVPKNVLISHEGIKLNKPWVKYGTAIDQTVYLSRKCTVQ